MNPIKSSFLPALLALLSLPAAAATLTYDRDLPQAQFAAAEIRAALAAAEKPAPPIGLITDPSLPPQAYRIQSASTGVTISGGDPRGIIYGALELVERIRFGQNIHNLDTITGSPHIERRGLKFNIPLDIRTPSYQDAGDAAQTNIAEMWHMDFWREYLDHMARFRYNALTLWNPHPFPSMIKMEDYPDVALQDVCGTSLPIDTDRPDEPVAKFIAGCGVSQAVLDNLIVLKKMTIEEKIEHWREVMAYAKSRGIDIYFITWSIKLNAVAPPGWYRRQENKQGENGLYGINNDQENPRTIKYLRAAVKEFILTYPDLAGIGLTAGENMEDRADEYDRVNWHWMTYGEGILDAKKEQPDREIRIIHRAWQAGWDKVMDQFVDRYPDPVDFSFKYARARMYATPAPRWADGFVSDLREYKVKSWWNIRNDDIFHFRWGDPEYARAFIRNLPPSDVTAGYHMGSDSTVWAREFISTRPNTPRDLEIHKHWYNFMLFGRLGYDPDLPSETILALLQLRFPETDAAPLSSAWATASKIVPAVNRFHWRNWDFMWAVEGCLDLRKGFHDVNDFIGIPPMEGSGLMSIPDYIASYRNDQHPTGLTPYEVAHQLQDWADESLSYVKSMRQSGLVMGKELSELLYDMQAMSCLGHYYASKILGATHLHRFRQGGSQSDKQNAIDALEDALAHWKAYAAAATANYRPQFMAKTRTIDWIRLTDDVRHDIEIARHATRD